jgi:ubiquinone/menaquinone biosynthesis C-methylase UbiE
MTDTIHTGNEQKAAAAFSRQSAVFDEIYSGNTIIQYKRKRVWDHINQFLKPGSRILELNAGTGEDAIYFAGQGHSVHATDISEGMLGKLREKVNERGLNEKISAEICSYTELEKLKHKGPYDLIFSNFAGLNCTDDLRKVLLSFEPLLAENGLATLVIMPPFSIWETFLVFQGQFKTAFRRLNSKNGRKARIEGVYFNCWYYKPSFMREVVKGKFEVIELEGLCSIVPPSFFEHFAEKHPKLYRFLCKWEGRLKSSWPWKYIGDYYIITLRKK